MSILKLKIPHLNRLTAYITFGLSRQSYDIIETRKDGYYKGDTTSHWAERHEVKKLSFHIKKRYLSRNFNDIKPIIPIPKEILNII